MHIIQTPLFDFEAFVVERGKDRLTMVLEAIDAEKLIITLEREHWTGRKGHSVRGMWAAFIAGVLYGCHSIADVARLLQRNKDIRLVCGFAKDDFPDEDALGRFLRKLVAHEALLEECFSGLVGKSYVRVYLASGLNWLSMQLISKPILMVIVKVRRTQMRPGELRKPKLGQRSRPTKGEKERSIDGLVTSCTSL